MRSHTYQQYGYRKWLNFQAHLECYKKMKSKHTHSSAGTKASIVELELECVSDYVRGWVEFAFYMETKDGLWLSESRGGDVEKTSVQQHRAKQFSLMYTMWIWLPQLLERADPSCSVYCLCLNFSIVVLGSEAAIQPNDYQWRHNSSADNQMHITFMHKPEGRTVCIEEYVV